MLPPLISVVVAVVALLQQEDCQEAHPPSAAQVVEVAQTRVSEEQVAHPCKAVVAVAAVGLPRVVQVVPQLQVELEELEAHLEVRMAHSRVAVVAAQKPAHQERAVTAWWLLRFSSLCLTLLTLHGNWIAGSRAWRIRPCLVSLRLRSR